MTLTDENLRFLHDNAVSAARQAGDIIRASQNRPLDVKTKTGGDTLASQVVTEVDLLSEKAIVDALQSSRDKFDLGLLTEERGDDGSRLVKDYFWCVDPIDGTLSFIEGVSGYAVSIGLVSKAGQALIGIVYDPLTDTLYSAIRGRGAWKNGEPWQLLADTSITHQALTLVCDRGLEAQPYYSELLSQFESVAKDMGATGLHTLHKGGAVMNGCWVLENTPACYFKIPKPQQGGGSLWDFAAITCLFEAMEVVVTAFDGKPLALNPEETTFMNNQGVIFATDARLANAIQQLNVG